MRKKSSGKKLVLCKSTIMNLNNLEALVVKGGKTFTDPRVCQSKTECVTVCDGTNCDTRVEELCPTRYTTCVLTSTNPDYCDTI